MLTQLDQAILCHRQTIQQRWHTHARALLLGAVTLGYAVVLALNLLTLLTPPTMLLVLHASPAGATRIGWIQPESTLWDRGVRWGDRVLSLDGRALAHGQNGLWSGQRLAVQGVAGRTITVSAAALRSGHDPAPLLPLGLWFFVLGTLVVLRAREPAVGVAAYAFLASAASALTLAPAADADEALGSVAEFACVLLFAACFVRFVLILSRTGHRWCHALFLPPLAVIVLGMVGLAWPALAASAARLRLLVVLAYLLLGITVLVQTCLRERERNTIRGVRIIGAGTAISILPFAMLYLLPVLLHHAPFVTSEHAALAFACLPSSLGYAISRHRALDTRLLQRWFVHGLLWAVLLLPFTAAVAARSWLLDATPEPARSLLLAAALALLAGLVFGLLRPLVQRALDRAIFKDSYDYRASLETLSHDLSLAGDLDSLGTRLSTTLRQLMNLEYAALLIRDGQQTTVSGSAGDDRPPLLTTLIAATEALEHDGPLVLPADHAGGLIVPLRIHHDTAGYLCLGPKATGEPFRGEDRALLATLSGHLAALVRNAHLMADLRAKVRALAVLNERLEGAREEERTRLAADLHDEPLQTALSLQREIAMDARTHAPAARHMALSQTLIDQLRALCTAMRPAALDHLGLLPALDQLARERGRRAGFPILIDADPELMDVELAAPAELVFYRVAQEAVSNCMRHARPGMARIILQRHDEHVRLIVADDGCGFAVPARFDTLVEAGHLGLAGMQERVRHAGGQCQITSVPGIGTTVQVDLPLRGEGRTA